MADKENVQKIMSELSDRLGISENQLKSAAKEGNVKDMLKNSDNEQTKKVEEILKDPQKTKDLLSSPQAQALIKLLGGE